MGDAGRLTEVRGAKGVGSGAAGRPRPSGAASAARAAGEQGPARCPWGARGAMGARHSGAGCHGGAWPAFITENENN